MEAFWAGDREGLLDQGAGIRAIHVPAEQNVRCGRLAVWVPGLLESERYGGLPSSKRLRSEDR
ncbi:hypothetical protein D9M70_575090 [compost metagenome]